jgi:hypothetical protein
VLRPTLSCGLQEREVDVVKDEFEEGRRREDPNVDVVWAGTLCLIAANSAGAVKQLH